MKLQLDQRRVAIARDAARRAVKELTDEGRSTADALCLVMAEALYSTGTVAILESKCAALEARLAALEAKKP